MKKLKLLTLIILCISLTSCFDKARIKVIGSSASVTTVASDYNYLNVGDTVQIERMGMDWEIDQNAVSFVDTSYIVRYRITNEGDTLKFLMEKRIGIVQKISK
jgi:hypothetical protein